MNALLFAAALKVLTIGNSFSVRMVESLPPVARDLGCEIDICSLYIGGCSLERHWQNIVASTNAALRPYTLSSSFNGAARPDLTGPGNIVDVIGREKWDIITIQQASHFSWRPETYSPWGDDLVAFIREKAPQAKILVHETWSYTPFDSRLAEWGIDQNEMYDRLHDAYAQFADRHHLGIIPTGTAVRDFRRELPVRYGERSLGGDVVGDFAADDFFHMGRDGNFLQALVWAGTLFDVDVTTGRFTPEGIDPERARFMRRIAAALRPMDVRYLSADGDDGADGLTPASAWRTIGKLNDALPAGGTARLRAGDVFYGTIRAPAGRDLEHPTVVTSYGEGPKPVITNTKDLKRDPSLWTRFGPGAGGTWKIDLGNEANYTGLTDAADETNAGFLLVDGEIMPWKKYCVFDLNRDWDFVNDAEGFLHVHLEENPAERAREIRVAVNRHGLVFASYQTISNIAIRAVGAHGMCGSEVTGIRVTDCAFENIGGSEILDFMPEERFRYGNGVEFWRGGSDAIIENCTFDGIYDVAFTMQGDHPVTGWSDIHFRNNLVRNSSQAFEIWVLDAPNGVGYRRCSFTGNQTENVGGGWGEMTRPNRRCATPLLLYHIDSDTFDIDVSGNIFGEAPHGLIFSQTGRLPDGYRFVR